MKIIIGLSTPFHLVHLARELSELGHEVTVIGYMPKWKMKNYDLGKANYICIFWQLFPISIFALQRIFPKLQRKTTFAIKPFVDFFVRKNLSECDVFIGLSGTIVDSLTFAKKKYGAVTICDRGSAHVETQNELIKKSGSQSLPSLYIVRELKGYESSDYIMVPSIFSANSFYQKRVKKEKILINNYGVNLSRFYDKCNIKQKSKSKAIKALFVGGWSYQKGVDLIIDVMNKDENILVTHIGTNGGEIFPDIDRFKRLGHIPNIKLSDVYAQFDMLLLPSRQDGFGMVILEALASGLPVVASTNTGAVDVKKHIQNKDCIEIMDEITSDALLNSIYKIKNGKCHRPILNSVDMEYYSWKAYAKRYDSFLEELI